MPTLLLLARLALAAVFLTAGLAKLADPGGSRRALLGFGLPRPLAVPMGLLLPLAEVAVGVLLLPASTATWGAAGALVLLLAFAAGIAANLAHGRTPDCHCFGQLHSRPTGPATLGRNLALAAVAAGVVVAGRDGAVGPSAVAWVTASPTGALSAGMAVLAAGLGSGLFALLRQNGRLLLRVEALEARLGLDAPVAPAGVLAPGVPAPSFRLPSVAGGEVGLDGLLSEQRPVLLVFSDAGCGPCRELLPEVARWQREHAERWTVAVVSRGDAEATRQEAREHGLRHVLLQRDREVSLAYGCAGTPGALLVDRRGRVAGPLLQGVEAIRAWVAGAAARPPETPAEPGGLPVGAPAPEIQLPMLDGPTFDLADLRGTDAVLVLWNPRCGYCQRMLPDLRAAESSLAADPRAPRLVVVSAGTAEENRALGLRSPVLLDEAFAVGRALGARGTPSAVWIDAAGRIASDVAVGAPAVLALVQRAGTDLVPAR